MAKSVSKVNQVEGLNQLLGGVNLAQQQVWLTSLLAQLAQNSGSVGGDGKNMGEGVPLRSEMMVVFNRRELSQLGEEI